MLTVKKLYEVCARKRLVLEACWCSEPYISVRKCCVEKLALRYTGENKVYWRFVLLYGDLQEYIRR